MHSESQIAIAKNSLEMADSIINMEIKEKAISCKSIATRNNIEFISDYQSILLGRNTQYISAAACRTKDTNGKGVEEFLAALPQLKDELNRAGFNDATLHCLGINYRFKEENGRIFTLTPPLIERLLDMNKPSDKIDSSFLASPFPNIFLEFGDPEYRLKGGLSLPTQTFSQKPRMVEGVFISEFIGSGAKNSKALLEHFGLTKKSTYRIFEVGVSYSPLSFVDNPKELQSILINGNALDYLMITIPEGVSLNECIDMNKEWLGENAHEFFNNTFPLIFNALLYMGLDTRVERKIIATKNKLPKTKPLKGSKLYKKIKSSGDYSTIKIGSNQPYYKPRFSKTGYDGTGKVSPHLRKGHFSIRWVKGENNSLRPELRRVKHSIIHKDLLSKDEVELLERSYEVM